VLHSIDLYVDAESADPALGDVLNSLVLAAAAGSALLAAWLVAAPETPTPPKVVRFFALASAGAAFFAVDDIVGVHESIGDNARARSPGCPESTSPTTSSSPSMRSSSWPSSCTTGA
jgi:hypothetical protein